MSERTHPLLPAKNTDATQSMIVFVISTVVSPSNPSVSAPMIPVVLILNAVYFENALNKENIQIVYAVLIAGFIGLVQLPLFIWYAGRVKSHIRSAVFYRTNIDVSRVL